MNADPEKQLLREFHELPLMEYQTMYRTMIIEHKIECSRCIGFNSCTFAKFASNHLRASAFICG